MPHFDIYHAENTIGLAVHARILGEALVAAGHTVRTVTIPYILFVYSEAQNNALYALPEPIPDSHCIFLESIFAHSMLGRYRSTIFISNPECFVERDYAKAKSITHFWHTTRMSQNILEPKFPDSTHTYIGFTSPAIIASEPLDYNTFIHFRGKSSQRHTQEILDAWQANPQWPQLRIQLYGPDCPIELNRWVHSGNISMYMGQMPRDVYEKEVASGGVHLCLSSQEGFGHYINEARSMGALVVTLDAPPMNELIKSNIGFLVPTCSVSDMNMGLTYKTSLYEVRNMISNILDIAVDKRMAMGINAKITYQKDRDEFLKRIKAIKEKLI